MWEIYETYFKFLDQLRESGTVNMFGAAQYLVEMFDLPKQEARDVLKYWMQTFGERQKEKQ